MRRRIYAIFAGKALVKVLLPFAVSTTSRWQRWKPIHPISQLAQAAAFFVHVAAALWRWQYVHIMIMVNASCAHSNNHRAAYHKTAPIRTSLQSFKRHRENAGYHKPLEERLMRCASAVRRRCVDACRAGRRAACPTGPRWLPRKEISETMPFRMQGWNVYMLVTPLTAFV